MCLTKKVILCAQCSSALKDSHLFDIWESVCRRTGVYKKPFYLLIDQEHEEKIRFLETHGYIISTEIDQHSLAIVPAKQYNCTTRYMNKKEENLFYCANPNEHLEECND